LTVPFVTAAFALALPFVAGVFFLGGDRSGATSGATRREAFRAGGAAGGISAGRSARVRGATMVREV
jgi:hypothetical protein